MKNHKTIRTIALIIPLLITLGFWVWAKIDMGMSIFNTDLAAKYIGQITALFAITLFSLTFLVSARYKWIEKVFGGLDKVYKYHGTISRWGFVFMLAHPILLAGSFMFSASTLQRYFIPFVSSDVTLMFGIIAWYLFITLIFITVFRLIPYHIWKRTHQLMGLAYGFGLYHAFFMYSDVRGFLPMTIFVGVLGVIGVGSYVYKVFLYNWIGPKYEYKIVEQNKRNDLVYDLILEPASKKMKFKAGEFVFMTVRGNKSVGKEHHPFSISSDPKDANIRLSYKVLGDYTKKLVNAKIGDKVFLYGPYGEFNTGNFSKYKNQVWISGGIGITPFLSMLKTVDGMNVKFINSNKSEDDFVYEDEIKQKSDLIDYWHYVSDNEGYLNAEKVLDFVGDLKDDVVFLFCGPKGMMHALKKQLAEKGVSPKKIIFEDFSLV
ncbi:hypothetical protein GF340_01675 [Candidatus Peregrinibacteria bacterium]|nr:hypothetical protein [Candidatus Peregrinibacteria bacterium]